MAYRKESSIHLVYGILGGGFKYVSCSSLFGEMIQFDLSIFFQRGWFNHQLVYHLTMDPQNMGAM